MKNKLAIALFLLSFATSCVSGLNVNQERKLIAVKNEHPELYQEEKSPTASGAFGILPGGGSFYTGHYAIGVVDLLLWPVSILWDPFNGINGAKELNYYATLSSVKRAKNKESEALKAQYLKGEIKEKDFNLKQMEIDSKYDLDKNL